jgi:hypothetical protein
MLTIQPTLQKFSGQKPCRRRHCPTTEHTGDFSYAFFSLDFDNTGMNNFAYQIFLDENMIIPFSSNLMQVSDRHHLSVAGDL